MNTKTNTEQDLIAQRRAKLAALREAGFSYPTDFRRDSVAAELHARYDDKPAEFFEQTPLRVRVAGRMMTRRIMGKASFCHIQDYSGRIQLFVTRDNLPDGLYQEFKKWDVGDILGAEGVLFKTKTGELSVKVDEIRLLAKCLRPLPEKYHGLTDREARYRQRYLDLIMNEVSRRTFIIRSQMVQRIRQFLIDRDFLEVETPMMQVIPGGAAARPFITYHNALDMQLYLRIAPELYLKRLVVGGFERVFEINRNFRNEGLSTQHNPEFTMLEFYQAYAEYPELMDLTETLLRELAESVLGSATVTYQGREYDFGRPFQRYTLFESLLKFNPGLAAEDVDNLESARRVAERLEIPVLPTWGLGKVQTEIFEKSVEPKLLDPTFITEYPVEVSPLARRNDQNPEVTDRFELFIAGREIANGFTELNDPEDQAERFRKQVEAKDAGDEEAMHFDEDYIIALEHGMPPTAGEGIGIDRLVMLLTDSPSIRDVLLFPHLRPRRDKADNAGPSE
ncbi:lysyl-tRNA synthetase, class II [Methylomarinovum caldicuralii]|uniref:Lysine--tRNA ligase n=1 Tax=Methylomarinovum caldicuralii TaxID=438856 RepID=A0AAU9C841_9GAMM|nr:lysine--tRNA ligase [Methylomarinovum caldicuralii]BCX81606.1 lysyl-tRNA synthetase, class II [Methylomarinovum caldicuralii]